MTDSPLHRRTFIGTAAISSFAGSALVRAGQGASRPKVCVYSEHFQSLPIPEVCRLFKQMGVDGLDLTVRPGGHIKPEEVTERLPVAVKAARDHGLEVMMLTTSITAPDQIAKQTFEACQEAGIDRIKLGYYRVGEFGSLARRLDEVRRQLELVVELAAKYGVRPCVHVHSGGTIPSSGMMLYGLLKGIEPERVGAYLDSHHMTITGGNGGWSQAIDLLKPWISLVALKNFQWRKRERGELGQQRWGTEYCRLEDGVAPIAEFVGTVQRAGYGGFYTLHTEYQRPVAECLRLTTEDFAYLKRVFAQQ